MSNKWKVGDYLYFDDEKIYKFIGQVIKIDTHCIYKTILYYSYRKNQCIFSSEIYSFKLNSYMGKDFVFLTESELNEFKAKVL